MNGGKKASIPIHGWTGERAPIPETPCVPKRQSKKNTRRWCGGKVGREHDPQWKTYGEVSGRLNTPQGRNRAIEELAAGTTGFTRWRISVCQLCGRHLGWERA